MGRTLRRGRTDASPSKELTESQTQQAGPSIATPAVELDPYEPPPSSHPRNPATTDESEETQNRQRSEQLSTQVMRDRYPELYASVEDVAHASTTATTSNTLPVRQPADKGKRPALPTINDDGDEELSIDDMHRAAAEYLAKAELEKAKTAYLQARQASIALVASGKGGNHALRIHDNRSRQASVVSRATTASSHGAHSHDEAEDFLRSMPMRPARTGTEDTPWAARWKAPAEFDRARMDDSDDDESDGERRSRRKPKSLPLKDYNIQVYQGKDQRELDLWAKSLGDMWKWSGDLFQGGQEQFVGYAARYITPVLRESWSRHTLEHPKDALRFPAMVQFLQLYLGDPVQRTNSTYRQWMKTTQRQGQTALELLQHLRSLEDFMPPVSPAILAMHYLAAMRPELEKAVRATGRKVDTREKIQAIASAIEEPTHRNLGRGRAQEQDRGSPAPEGDGKRKRDNRGGRGGSYGKRGRGGYQGRGGYDRADAPQAGPSNTKLSAPNATPLGTNERKPGTCYVCHEPGHLAPDCPNRNKVKQNRNLHALGATDEDEDSKNEPASP